MSIQNSKDTDPRVLRIEEELKALFSKHGYEYVPARLWDDEIKRLSLKGN